MSLVNAISSMDWRTQIIAYLCNNYELVEEHELKHMKQRARGYIMKGEYLYKLGVSAPLLKCISQEEGIELLKEIHSGYYRSQG